jgi:hypothetical protein
LARRTPACPARTSRIVSIEKIPLHDPFVDLFSRPGGGFGFEGFRCDLEGGAWPPIQYNSRGSLFLARGRARCLLSNRWRGYNTPPSSIAISVRSKCNVAAHQAAGHKGLPQITRRPQREHPHERHAGPVAQAYWGKPPPGRENKSTNGSCNEIFSTLTITRCPTRKCRRAPCQRLVRTGQTQTIIGATGESRWPCAADST